ncbi:MAG: hypothetical protein QM501_09375 [Gimesia sp.]
MKTFIPHLIVLFSLFYTAPLMAQRYVSQPADPYWNSPSGFYWNPLTALEYRTYAVADLVRARGSASVDYAYARKLHAEAARMEIQNWVLRLKAYYEGKAIREAEKLKRAYNHLDSKRLQKNRMWERLKNHPDLNKYSIENGKALNFLMDRLSSSILAYEYSTQSHSMDQVDLEKLNISPEVLHGIMIQQRLSNGQFLIFRADEGKPLDTDWWPWMLRDEDFKEQRTEFEKQRELVIQEAKDGKISNKSLNELYVSFEKIRDQFNQNFTKSDRFKNGMKSWQQFHRTETFLKSLWGQISLLQSTGDISILGSDLKIDADEEGSNLIALLRYLSRNGLEFSAAKPGDEPAYHQLYKLMRDLYVNVADEDESLKPQTIKYQQLLKRDGKPDIGSGSVLDK